VSSSAEGAEARAGAGAARPHVLVPAKLAPGLPTAGLPLALAEAAAGNLAAARRAIDESIRRDREDWRPWLVAARIETRLGDVAAAARSQARARSLDPRSPVFSPPR
jgi:Tfp pilus assembly protein PilF